MDIVLVLIFLFANLTTVGVCHYSYGNLNKYTRGMIMGVHIPPEAVETPEVQNICQKSKKIWNKFNRVNLVLALLICALVFWSFEGFMAIWCIWLAGYIAASNYLILTPHKEMYQLKIENNWIDEKAKHLVYVDTKTSADTKKMAYNWKYHILICGILLFTGLLLFSRNNLSMQELNGWVFFGLTLFLTITFCVMHLWVVSRRNEVYSQEQELNYAINQMVKQAWSAGLLAADAVNGVSWCYLVIQMLRNDWLSRLDFTIYTLLQLAAALVLIVPLLRIPKKKQELLDRDTAPVYVDDDEYWKSGWYYNPNDSRVFVQDRMSSTNYTFNMARPISKILCGAIAVLVLVTFLGTTGLMISLSGSNTKFSVNGTEVVVKASFYRCEFDMSEIEAVELLAEMPKENFFKTNGAATEDYSIGYFSGNQSGPCMLFLYGTKSPILKITLPEQIVYANSKEEGAVEAWYEALKTP